MLTHQSNPRHLLDKIKEELYLITKDPNIAEGREQVVKTIYNTLFLDNIEDLYMLSHALLKATQIMDIPKVAITVIRAIAKAINNIQETLKEQEVTMELTMDTPWMLLQMYMMNIKNKLGILTSAIKSQDQIIISKAL